MALSPALRAEWAPIFTAPLATMRRAAGARSAPRDHQP